jgi:hypothetical protein
MPDMKIGDSRCGAHDLLNEAIEAVRRDDAATIVPSHVEAAVVRAWDEGTGASMERQRGRSPFGWRAAAVGALAASVIVAAAVWTPRGQRAVDRDAAPTESALEDPLAQFPEYASTSLAVDGMLDEDPASLQYVQMRVEPSVLTAFGFPVPNPADDQPVNVEVLVGLDGVPRAIRHVTSFGSQP